MSVVPLPCISHQPAHYGRFMHKCRSALGNVEHPGGTILSMNRSPEGREAFGRVPLRISCLLHAEQQDTRAGKALTLAAGSQAWVGRWLHFSTASRTATRLKWGRIACADPDRNNYSGSRQCLFIPCQSTTSAKYRIHLTFGLGSTLDSPANRLAYHVQYIVL